MSGNKWRVEQFGQFLGHHQGHTAQDIIYKAIKSYGPYYKDKIDTAGIFDLYKESDHIEAKL